MLVLLRPAGFPMITPSRRNQVVSFRTSDPKMASVVEEET